MRQQRGQFDKRGSWRDEIMGRGLGFGLNSNVGDYSCNV